MTYVKTNILSIGLLTLLAINSARADTLYGGVAQNDAPQIAVPQLNLITPTRASQIQAEIEARRQTNDTMPPTAPQRLIPQQAGYVQTNQTPYLRGNNTNEMGCLGCLIAEHMVTRVVPGMPADLGGLRLGDTIIKINGQNILGLSNIAVCTMIVGIVGTSVTLEWIRPSDAYLHRNTFIRVPLSRLPAGYSQSLELTLNAMPR